MDLLVLLDPTGLYSTTQEADSRQQLSQHAERRKRGLQEPLDPTGLY